MADNRQLLPLNQPMYRNLDEGQRTELQNLHLPLPSARVEYDPGDPREALVNAVLAEEGLQREQLKLKGFRRLFFSRGERAALCLPKDLQHEVGEDELNRGRPRLVLAFELPRGAYATLIVKRVTAVKACGFGRCGGKSPASSAVARRTTCSRTLMPTARVLGTCCVSFWRSTHPA